MSMFRSFLDINELSEANLRQIINQQKDEMCLAGRNIGMLFEKYSTRTRLSFQVAISTLGGNSIDLRMDELNISRNESFEDTFRAMNCYLDGLVFRTTSHQKLIEASKYFEKPIINALSDKSHPCQIISDLFTLNEHFKNLELNILWMGDINNVCYSLIEAAKLISEIKLTICSPLSISSSVNIPLEPNINIISDLNNENLSQIDCVMTDVFISMNEENNDKKILLLKPYTVTPELMSKTSKNSVFMHCLPANVGLEVKEEVFKSNKSIVWRQAYNRLIAQKNLFSLIFSENS